MPSRPIPIASLLQCVQRSVARRQTNAYQIAKATGLPLRSVQKLLAQKSNPTLRNVETIMSGLGLSFFVRIHGIAKIKPGRRVAMKPPRKDARSGRP
jgi:DNA-binding phage protein